MGFGSVVNAEEIEVIPYTVYSKQYFTRGVSDLELTECSFTPYNGELEYHGDKTVSLTRNGSYTYSHIFTLKNGQRDIFFQGGREVKLTFNNIYFSVYRVDIDYLRNPNRGKVLITYLDGSAEYIEDVEIVSQPGNPYVTMSVSFLPEKDVLYLEFQLFKDFTIASTDTTKDFTMYMGEYGGDGKHTLTIDRSSEEAGLLSGLLAFVKDIKETLTTVKDTLLNLPSLIWERISEGLKSLFIPSDEYIIQFKEDIDSLLSVKFGAVYQVVDITLNSWDKIQEYDYQDTIEIPKTCIPLPDECEFEFGGQQVQIVPEGFEFLANSCKIATAIACTVLFINGLKKRYDDTMEG